MSRYVGISMGRYGVRQGPGLSPLGYTYLLVVSGE